MTARANSSAKKTLSRVAGAVKTTAKKVKARLRPANVKPKAAKAPPARAKKTAAPPTERKRRPQSDVPLDGKTYTPTQTSLKAPFRASGVERERDKETGREDRWNDEDRLTNKSGDPRIGTHGRTYEPGESKLASKGRK